MNVSSVKKQQKDWKLSVGTGVKRAQNKTIFHEIISCYVLFKIGKIDIEQKELFDDIEITYKGDNE